VIDGSKMGLMIILPLVVASALMVVYVKYQSRVLFTQLKQETKAQDVLEVEWSRLQLEQTTWSSNARIEKIAKKQLGLQAPTAEQVIFIKMK
jgi:cell division protein FtsL